jgi:pimeloyl-ACP methyl ester carboxylesterase
MTTTAHDDETYRLDRARWSTAWDETGFVHQVTRINGTVGIHSVLGGDGPLVVLLHGFPQNWREWRRIMPALVAAGYTVLAPDLRGFGDYALTAGHQEQVEQLVLMEAIPAGLEATGAPSGPTLNREIMWHPAFFRTPDLPEALIPGRERELLTYFFHHAAYDPTAFSDADIDEYATALGRLGALRGALAHHRSRPTNLAQNKEFARQRLRMPVLAIGAANSFADRIAEAARQFADEVTAAVAEKSGHWIPEERPVWLTNQLTTFFSTHRP